MTEQQKKLADSMFWWHKIKLTEDYTTPGICDHTVATATSRFGLPEDLTGKTVRDIGSWDGMFAFEAERRGAKSVIAIDIYQACAGQIEANWNKANRPFQLAKEILGSKVEYYKDTLESQDDSWTADIVLYYGVLYHIENPLGALKKLATITKEICLIETTYAKDYANPVLEYRPGFENDPTNAFYPSLSWLKIALKQVGFSKTELVWADDLRCTVRAYK